MASEQDIKKEKDAAKQLRKSRWWQNKLDNAACHYCHKKIDKTEATMDHVLPISDGGKSTKNNIVVCCKPCNSNKKNMSYVEWTLYLEKLTTSY